LSNLKVINRIKMLKNNSIIKTSWAWPQEFGIVPGRVTHQYVYTCGMIPLAADGSLVGRGDAGAQARRVFENIGHVLKLGRCDMTHIVSMTVYLSDVAHYPAFKAVRAEVFPDGYAGVSTVVGATLIDPDILIEVAVVAEQPVMPG
jgi:enamine deaminase RidA (YjgF/YER057c/UK114 family)